MTGYKPMHADDGITYTFDGYVAKDGVKFRKMTYEEHMDMSMQIMLKSE